MTTPSITCLNANKTCFSFNGSVPNTSPFCSDIQSIQQCVGSKIVPFPEFTLIGDIGSATSVNQTMNVPGFGGIQTFSGSPIFNITDLRNLTPYIVGQDQIDSEFLSIQGAIDRAVADGASTSNPQLVIVKAGTYVENIVLAQGIRLLGLQKTSIIDGHISFPATALGACLIDLIIAPTTLGVFTSAIDIDIPFVGSLLPYLQNCEINIASGLGAGISGIRSASSASSLIAINSTFAVSGVGQIAVDFGPGGTCFLLSSFISSPPSETAMVVGSNAPLTGGFGNIINVIIISGSLAIRGSSMFGGDNCTLLNGSECLRVETTAPTSPSNFTNSSFTGPLTITDTSNLAFFRCQMQQITTIQDSATVRLLTCELQPIDAQDTSFVTIRNSLLALVITDPVPMLALSGSAVGRVHNSVVTSESGTSALQRCFHLSGTGTLEVFNSYLEPVNIMGGTSCAELKDTSVMTAVNNVINANNGASGAITGDATATFRHTNGGGGPPSTGTNVMIGSSSTIVGPIDLLFGALL